MDSLFSEEIYTDCSQLKRGEFDDEMAYRHIVDLGGTDWLYRFTGLGAKHGREQQLSSDEAGYLPAMAAMASLEFTI